MPSPERLPLHKPAQHIANRPQIGRNGTKQEETMGAKNAPYFSLVRLIVKLCFAHQTILIFRSK